jgi:Zn finger protein HypA/HybF involved in hydrogenase expression|tara:strand:- start:418 stop:588 length:171 start_codon:yes stop_codon:yes gene_type:complete
MEDNRQFFECQECGAEGSAATDMDLVVEFCPFCGEPLDNIDWEEDYENFNSEGERS